MPALLTRTALVIGVVATSLAGCTYYRTYQTPAAASAPNVIVQQRAPDTVVVPDRSPGTVIVPAEPNTVIVPDRDADSPRTIIVNPRPN